LKTRLEVSPLGVSLLVGRLKNDMLSQPGLLIVRFVNPDGMQSNEVALEVVGTQ
jgi:microcompartment protein CcmK/EutM